MSATVHIQDDSIALLADGIPIGSRRPLSKDACAQLAGFARRYTLLEYHRDPRAALALGQELYRWLDGEQQGLSRLLEGNVGTLLLTLHCPSRHPTAAEWVVLQAPWELLANAEGHLAADPLLQFALVRRLGPIQTASAPDDYRLALAFMAAAPDGVSELDYEAEEAAILSAVGNTQLDLLVEESGEAQTLGRRLAEAGGLPVLHLSCHGHGAWRVQQDATPQPILLLEDDAGGAHPTSAPELLRALRPALPRLLFLSACSSAAAPSQAAATGGLPPAADHKAADGGSGRSAPPSPAHSLTSALIEAGLPAIIGWDGPVADSAATQFAAELYARLACGEGLALAVAEARRRLLESESDSLRRDWHLARLWLGPQGDASAPLVAGTRARSLLPADYVPGELLGKKDLLGNAVPVASHELFVGRRRELQRALRDLKGQRHAGVLITGMGRLGKSSLAARLANRCRDDLALAVLHGRFGLEDLLERLDDTLAPYPAARELIRQGQTQVRAARSSGEDAALQALGDLLTDLLTGPCRQHDASVPALMLVLDDFEQLLDERAGVRTVQTRSVGLITTLVRAFDPMRTTSRLLVTSRFPFRLGPPGADPAERLARLELASFNDTAERKLTLRQQTLARLQTLPDLEAREALIPRARAAARGNPGLLDLLSARLVLNPKVPLATATAALEQMESYLAGGDLPTSEELRAQLEAIAVQSLLDLAGAAGCALLRALTLFALPVPSAIATGLATELGGDLEVLRDLALLEPGADPVLPGETGVRLSPLAAARLEPLTDTEAAAFAPLVAQPLFATWGGEAGGRPAVAELQLARLALAAKDAALAVRCGANAIEAMEVESYPEAARLGSALVGLLEDTQTPLPPRLLASAARVLRNSGDDEAAERLLLSGSAVLDAGLETLAPMDAAYLLVEQADRAQTKGELAQAETLFQQAATCAERADNSISVAVARGRIADILQARGQLEEALRIRTEEDLPVYERLGDVRSKAVTQGQIADILQARGQLEEALRILTEDVLAAFERLGDVRLKAVTQGKIADILQARGQLEEALRIRTEEQLPVYERLGDVREKAVTQGGIADILQARGQLEEALRIRTEEELPVYERLGDVRSKAVTQGKIADILQARGQREEALRILTEDVLAAFERLGDVRLKAVTQGKIADILQARGQLEEALRIRTEEDLPVYERLGDVRSKAVTQGQIADILQARGQLEEALRIRTEEELPVYERLGDVREKAVTQGKIADVLRARGQLEEALRILTEEVLTAFERLGDVCAKAVTQGRIADILQARGQLEEALRIRTEEELPVYERLGDVRAKAVTQGKIADVLQARGQLEEVLRIRTEEELPVYERLGDVREKAVTQGKIADILQARGQLEEALRIRTEEELPIYERLGDVREKAVTQRKIADVLEAKGRLDEALDLLQNHCIPPVRHLGAIADIAVFQGRIADILRARGQLEEALRILTEEVLTAFERLGDVRAKAVTQGKIADILQARGQLEEALRIRTEEELPVYERLGDVREKAVTQARIASILQARGQLDEALHLLTEEVSTVFERLGDVRELLVCRAKIALNLLARNDSDDRQPANTLLCLALAEAQRLGLPEAGQIEQILNHFEMDCGRSPLQPNGAADADQ